mmetsp:Transcript_7582/g.8280  ORF Transcript_7582/g.8280 Transcript_7582/m.8280 type:complete len:228 (-) Transcript_7582:182-865(-)
MDKQISGSNTENCPHRHSQNIFCISEGMPVCEECATMKCDALGHQKVDIETFYDKQKTCLASILKSSQNLQTDWETQATEFMNREIRSIKQTFARLIHQIEEKCETTIEQARTIMQKYIQERSNSITNWRSSIHETVSPHVFDKPSLIKRCIDPEFNANLTRLRQIALEVEQETLFSSRIFLPKSVKDVKLDKPTVAQRPVRRLSFLGRRLRHGGVNQLLLVSRFVS